MTKQQNTITANTDTDKMLDTWSANVEKAKHADDYTPVLNDIVRTTNTNTVIDATTNTTPNATPLSNTDLNKVLNAWSADVNKVKHANGYTPVFNDTVRTIIYIIALTTSVVGLGFMTFGHADIGGFISTAAGIIAGGFGVAYNPLRQN